MSEVQMGSWCGACGPQGEVCTLLIGHGGRHESYNGYGYLLKAWRTGQETPEIVREPEPETVLQEAQRLVYGERGETYGHPLDDFTRTAQLWSVVLDTTVDAEDVALCMILLKLSRQLYQPKRDSVVDIAGYAECLQRVIDERERRGKDLGEDSTA